jgi:hypothetical protein
MTDPHAERPVSRKKLVIAIIGCAVAIGSAVVGGFVKARIEDKGLALRRDLAAVNAEIARRDHFSDIAAGYDAKWQQTRLMFHVLAGTRGWVFPPALESLENGLADSLMYGYMAAHGKEPASPLSAQYDSWAHLVTKEEERIAMPSGPHRAAETATTAAALAEVVGGVNSERPEQIRLYWSNRTAMLARQDKLGAEIQSSDLTLRRIGSVVVSLQILGLMIVLTKDLAS